MNKTVVSAQWLNDHLNDPDLIVLDASPKSNSSSIQVKYPSVKIPKARHINIKGNFADKEAQFPNTMLSSGDFELAARRLGINKNSTIVVYDNLGIYSSPRVWWMFTMMGHENIMVLDGGLNAWKESNYQTVGIDYDFRVAEYPLGDFIAQPNEAFIVDYEQISQNTKQNNFTTVDARSKARFEGSAPEPRASLQSGQIPRSINIPYQSVLEHGKYKSSSELKAVFDQANVEPGKLVFSCGSGMTACIVMLANEIIGETNRFLFDGSWTEWATRQNLTITS